jgi:fermentation-respiration switch protein FrsA (DUF1100 family)
VPINTKAPTVAAQVAQVSVDSFTFDSQALAGNLLGDPSERPAQVILPPGYETSTKRYPVIYYMHGYGMGTATTKMLDFMRTWYGAYAGMYASNLEVATGDLVGAVEQGVQLGMQEMILVFPNASNALGGTMFTSSPSNGDVEAYLTQELVEYVDSHYRTLPQRESRGVAGCSMGGDGTIHLAFKYPDVYSVAAAQGGVYFYDEDPLLTGDGLIGFTKEPKTLVDFGWLPGETQAQLAVAAAVAPNPDRPPLYFDMPYVLVDGTAEVAPGYLDKVRAMDPRSDVERYLAQPVRLNGLLVQHGAADPVVPVELGRKFDQLLTEKDVDHAFDDSYGGHCTFDMVSPMLQFMSDHLVSEPVEE